MIVVGDPDYSFRLTKLAYSLRGAVDLDYLHNQGFRRVNELMDHASKIAKELNDGR